MKNKEEKIELFPSQNYEKKTIPEILSLSKEINLDLAAEEVLNWATNNVEYFIDSQIKTFKLDLVLDTELMPETKKLQDLYRAIPEDESVVPKAIMDLDQNDQKFKKAMNSPKIKKAFKEIQGCREELDKITDKIHKVMQKKKEIKEKLFQRMIFFYEMVGISNGRPLIMDLDGGIEILKFEYEAFPVGVRVRLSDSEVKGLDGEITTIEGKTKEYVIPEGFTVWIEIAYRPKVSNAGMF